MRYMIHTNSEHEWYVNDFLIPSMKVQGIRKSDIKVFFGTFRDMCKLVGEKYDPHESIWHLSGDIVVSKRFREATAKVDSAVAAGFCNIDADGGRVNYIGKTSAKGMWKSEECLLVPNFMASSFAEWSSENPDGTFRDYMIQFNIPSKNLMPNIVDNIGHMTDKYAPEKPAYWRDASLEEAVEELAAVLEVRPKKRSFLSDDDLA